MRTTSGNLFFERKGIICGAAFSIMLFFAPNVVQAQLLPDESEEPVRMQLQGPICGKLEALPKTGQTASASSTPRPSSPSATSLEKASTVTPASSFTTKNVAKLPVGTFNQTQHVKEFSWLPDGAATAATAASTADKAGSKNAEEAEKPPVKQSAGINKKTPAKILEKETNKTDAASEKEASVSKTAKSKIDPESVKVARKPHCSGVADYYADQFHGKRTASGQLHDRDKFTAAHRTLPFGTKLKVVNRHTGKACVVTVNDRGPFTRERIIDLSSAAAKELGLMTAKSRLVDCYLVENE